MGAFDLGNLWSGNRRHSTQNQPFRRYKSPHFHVNSSFVSCCVCWTTVYANNRENEVTGGVTLTGTENSVRLFQAG